MTRPLLDFPSWALRPRAAIVISPSYYEDGEITRQGFEMGKGIAGSRNRVKLEFTPMLFDVGHWLPWVINRARTAFFRVNVFNSPQLAYNDEIRANEALYEGVGIPFDPGQRFSTGQGFAYKPHVRLNQSALKGENVVELDMSAYPNVLTYGKVFGIGHITYHVQDITYQGDIATVEITPPLRSDVTADPADQSSVKLRPYVIVSIKKVSELVNLFEPGGISFPGSVTLDEHVDARFL